MSVHFHIEQYEQMLEIFDQNKAFLPQSLISELAKSGSKLSKVAKRGLEELKAREKGLKYERDFK